MSTFSAPLVRKEREDSSSLLKLLRKSFSKEIFMFFSLVNLLLCPYMSDFHSVKNARIQVFTHSYLTQCLKT